MCCGLYNVLLTCLLGVNLWHVSDVICIIYMHCSSNLFHFIAIAKCWLFADLVVCQLSVVRPVGQSVGRLYLTRFQSGSAPLVICLPGYETAEVSAVCLCLHLSFQLSVVAHSFLIYIFVAYKV